MENKKTGFSDYLNELKKTKKGDENNKIAAIVMNANPFTLGHQYLIEKVSKEMIYCIYYSYRREIYYTI